MLELFTIEQLEQELQKLYVELEKVKDDNEKRHIQRSIQERNLKLIRLMPNE